MRNEKKIKKEVKNLMLWLTGLEEKLNDLKSETNEKKRAKLEKKIKSDKDMVIFVAKDLEKAGGSLDDLIPQLNEVQKTIVDELFTLGGDIGSLEEQKKRNSIISRHKDKIIKIKEMQSKYPEYDINLPPKEKLNNKMYKYEKSLGVSLYDESDKESVIYKPEWNYLKHMETSKEFTEEEKAIMDRCYEVGVEYYAQGGSILNKMGEAVEDWGEITQARTWCKKIYKDVCMPLLKWVNPNKVYAPGEREYEAKQMAKRLIEFCLNEEQHKELVETWNRLYSDSKLDGYSYDEKCDIIVGILSEKIGVEKTAFINAYMYLSEEHKEDMQLLRNYTYEEMGLE